MRLEGHLQLSSQPGSLLDSVLPGVIQGELHPFSKSPECPAVDVCQTLSYSPLTYSLTSGDKDLLAQHDSHFQQLCRHPVASHFMQAVVTLPPSNGDVTSESSLVFRPIWNRIMRKNLQTFIEDPSANFVVAAAFEGMDAKGGMADVLALPPTVWSDCIGKPSLSETERDRVFG